MLSQTVDRPGVAMPKPLFPRAGTIAGGRAVIDIGSNTVRLVVYGDPPRAPVVLLNEKVTARLGRGVAENGMLSEKSMASALTGLRRFALLLSLRGVARVDTVATAAVRDARNGGDFLDAVRALGLSPRLLSGEEEATTSARGVEAAFPGARGVVADLGGGSLEIVHVDGQECRHGVSLPLGSLRLPAMRASGGAGFSRRVRSLVRDADWRCAPGESLYLVGGSFRALARFAVWRDGDAIDDPHGFELSAAQATSLCRKLAGTDQPPLVPGLSLSRQASLPHTAALLGALVREIEPGSLVFSSWGLREGVLHGALAPGIRASDPLEDGVGAFVETMGVSPEDARRVTTWTAQAAQTRDPAEERLRRCFAMLALAAQAIEPNLRPDTMTNWTLRKRWIGLDASGRAALWSAALANAGGPPPDRTGIASAQADLVERARSWGLAVRLCRRFSHALPAALAASSLGRRGDRLVLAVSRPFDALLTEGTEKDLRMLADSLSLHPAVEIHDPA